MPSFESLEFDSFHTDELPRLLGDGRGAEAARSCRGLGSLAFRRTEGGAYTYVPGEDGVEIVVGDDGADTVLELDDATWRAVVEEREAAAGLLYGGRAHCRRGKAIRWLAWEPGLRAMYNGRRYYDPADVHLEDRHGNPLDVERTFNVDDDRDDMAHFLRTAGYLFVRNVFSPEEIDRFLAEAGELRAEAVKGDKLSWWGKNAEGEEVLCRVTRAAAKPALRSLPSDARLLALKDLSHETLEHRRREGAEEGVSLIFKNPSMTEGLSDIPWHRDCGMGGHAVNCPILIVSTFLTPSNSQTGDLRMLPGSWNRACAPVDANHPKAPTGASFDARPGDVTLHYSDTMHAAPPPERTGDGGYRISAVTGYVRPGAAERGSRNYNSVLHQRDDGQIEHLTDVARRS